MSIVIAPFEEGQPFQPAGHHGVGPVHLFGGQDYTGAVTVALSHYLPGGRADLSPVPAETLYLVLTGTLSLTDGDGVTHTLRALDGARLPAGDRSQCGELHQPACEHARHPAEPGRCADE